LPPVSLCQVPDSFFPLIFSSYGVFFVFPDSNAPLFRQIRPLTRAILPISPATAFFILENETFNDIVMTTNEGVKTANYNVKTLNDINKKTNGIVRAFNEGNTNFNGINMAISDSDKAAKEAA
jgi:hypothetical protein